MEEPSARKPGGPGEGKGEPRAAVRAFLRQLLEALSLEETAGLWPEVGRGEAFEALGTIRARSEQVARSAPSRPVEISRYLRIFGETAAQLLLNDHAHPAAPPPAPGEAQLAIVAAGRPVADEGLNQLSCTPGSACRRVERMLEDLHPPGSRALFLGDDDLCSLALGSRDAGFEITAVDLDERLLEFIESCDPEIEARRVDLGRGGLPGKWLGAFDVVFTDPHWSYDGAIFFVDKAALALKDDGQGRLYLSLCPVFCEPDTHRLFGRLADLGLVLEGMEPFFSWYDLEGLPSPNPRDLLRGQLGEGLVSPFVEALVEMPFGYSNLYILRKTGGSRWSRPRKALFRWWHRA